MAFFRTLELLLEKQFSNVEHRKKQLGLLHPKPSDD